MVCFRMGELWSFGPQNVKSRTACRGSTARGFRSRGMNLESSSPSRYWSHENRFFSSACTDETGRPRMTKHPLRAYWWRGGPRYGNFGDLLTPALLEHLSGRPVEHCSPHEADIIAVGSVLEPGFWPAGSWTGFAGYIWGAGRMTGERPMEMPAARVEAVRGKWTLRALECRNSSIATTTRPSAWRAPSL